MCFNVSHFSNRPTVFYTIFYLGAQLYFDLGEQIIFGTKIKQQFLNARILCSTSLMVTHFEHKNCDHGAQIIFGLCKRRN